MSFDIYLFIYIIYLFFTLCSIEESTVQISTTRKVQLRTKVLCCFQPRHESNTPEVQTNRPPIQEIAHVKCLIAVCVLTTFPH